MKSLPDGFARIANQWCSGMVSAAVMTDEALGRLKVQLILGRLPRSCLVQRGHRRCVYRVMLPLREGAVEVVVKEHRPDATRSGMANAWCFGRAVRALRAACRLADAGFRTFEPIAALCSRAKGPLHRAWLVVRPLSGVPLRERLIAPPDAGEPELLLTGAAREVARLHDARFWHGDLKPKNILVQDQRDGSLRFGFIDIDRTGRSPRWLPIIACLWQSLDLRKLVSHLRGHCSVGESHLAGLTGEYYRARGFGPVRRRVWDAIGRFPHKVVTRRRRVRARRAGKKAPASPSRLGILIKNLF